MIAIIDYGVGNLFSLSSSLTALGEQNEVTADADRIKKADKLILPGVGAFSDAIEKLKNTGLIDALNTEVSNGKPLLGICLGMQLLFEKSYEYGCFSGLSYIKGDVIALKDAISDKELKIPQMGWNSLRFDKKDVLINDIKNGDYVYFVHSYHAVNCKESRVAHCDYGGEVTAIVRNKNVCGTQFHPEKSGGIGLKILKNFCTGGTV